MNLKQLADIGGCIVVEVGPGWGGKYCYQQKGHEHCTECGYKTKTAAREAWLENTVSKEFAQAIKLLLKEK